MSRQQTVYPTLRYDDAPAAIVWLQQALAFDEQAVHKNDDGTIAHAQLAFGGDLIMLGSQPADAESPTGGAWTYMVTDDPDGMYARAREAGAEVVHQITDQDYGSREFTVRDPEGNLWSVGTYQPQG